MFDKLVKVFALLLGLLLLLIFYAHTENGRFQMRNTVGGCQLILDTRTGDVYRSVAGKWVKMEREPDGGTITVEESEVTPVEHK